MAAVNKVNYQKELDKILEKLPKSGSVAAGRPPRLFLHSCCAPCSSYVLEYLSVYFEITVFYFNPNITARAEYQRRVEEQKRLIALFNEEGGRLPIHVEEGDYVPERFLEVSKGLEACPEGGERCVKCYELRLRETARGAVRAGADYFGTTLTISPMKDAQRLNAIGLELARKHGVPWLPSDFKKRDGFRRSVELSEKYGLYRQDYCGCGFSMAERDRRNSLREAELTAKGHAGETVPKNCS